MRKTEFERCGCYEVFSSRRSQSVEADGMGFTMRSTMTMPEIRDFVSFTPTEHISP